MPSFHFGQLNTRAPDGANKRVEEDKVKIQRNKSLLTRRLFCWALFFINSVRLRKKTSSICSPLIVRGKGPQVHNPKRGWNCYQDILRGESASWWLFLSNINVFHFNESPSGLIYSNDIWALDIFSKKMFKWPTRNKCFITILHGGGVFRDEIILCNIWTAPYGSASILGTFGRAKQA